VLAVAAPAPAPAADARPASHATVRCRRTLAHYPVLVPGDRRPAVATLQCTLNDLGEGPVAVDGFYGPQTKAAVADIEAGFEGVPAHPGQITAGFWVLLFGRQLPHPLPGPGDSGHAVTVLQRALRAAGYALAVDGSYGDQTRSVVAAYRKRFGSLNFCLREGCALPHP
jgi:peptidoglycan hydrolase-like protein with peptidoglycan-binding domain